MADTQFGAVLEKLGHMQGTLDAVKENQESLKAELRNTDREHETRIASLETGRARLIGAHAGATGLLAMIAAWFKWGGNA